MAFIYGANVLVVHGTYKPIKLFTLSALFYGPNHHDFNPNLYFDKVNDCNESSKEEGILFVAIVFHVSKVYVRCVLLDFRTSRCHS